MIHAHDGSRLRQPIALDGGVSQPSPEFLGYAVERSSAGNECPEFPAKPAMHAPKDPPAMQEVFALGGPEPPLKILEPAFIPQVAFNLLLQRLQHAGHCDQHRHSLAPNGANDFTGI